MLQISCNETPLQKKIQVLKNSLNSSYYTATCGYQSGLFKCLYLLQLEN